MNVANTVYSILVIYTVYCVRFDFWEKDIYFGFCPGSFRSDEILCQENILELGKMKHSDWIIVRGLSLLKNEDGI